MSEVSHLQDPSDLLCTPLGTGVAVVMPQRHCWLLVMPKLVILLCFLDLNTWSTGAEIDGRLIGLQLPTKHSLCSSTRSKQREERIRYNITNHKKELHKRQLIGNTSVIKLATKHFDDGWRRGSIKVHGNKPNHSIRTNHDPWRSI
jgi:hypothetical protein